jgi:hypothetical protein
MKYQHENKSVRARTGELGAAHTVLPPVPAILATFCCGFACPVKRKRVRSVVAVGETSSGRMCGTPRKMARDGRNTKATNDHRANLPRDAGELGETSVGDFLGRVRQEVG